MTQKNLGNKKSANETVEVLYQKMGNRWFAFSMIQDEVFVGSITQDEINALENGETPKKTYDLTGNS